MMLWATKKNTLEQHCLLGHTSFDGPKEKRSEFAMGLLDLIYGTWKFINYKHGCLSTINQSQTFYSCIYNAFLQGDFH